MAYDQSRSVTDAIEHVPKPRSGDTVYRLVMIPGNPGLISFYHDFLMELAANLETVEHACFLIEGYSLRGFEISKPPAQPVGLQEQVDYVETLIDRAIEGDKQLATQKVILMGHSVGSYLLLEVLRRHRIRQKDQELPYRIIGGICLFPTVVDIAISKSGRRATRVLNVPWFALIARSLVVLIIRLIPSSLLLYLIRLITRFPDDAAGTVRAYLQSAMGVRETLHMARDEMNEITADKWDDDVWGSATSLKKERTKLYFYFGEDDHWVANRTRQDLLATRACPAGSEEYWRPQMDIDQDGTPHGFCISTCCRFPMPSPFTTACSADMFTQDIASRSR